MKKILKKLLCFLILPIALIAVGCTGSTSNNPTQIEEEVKPSEDSGSNQPDFSTDNPIDTTNPETPAEPDAPAEPVEPDTPAEPVEPDAPVEPETPVEPVEPENTQYTITFEIVTAFEESCSKEWFDCPMELTKSHPEFAIETNEGILIYISKDFGMTQFAIHFKNKEGKNIVTTQIDGKQYLEIDFYHTAMNNVYFSINGKEYEVENSGGMVVKKTFRKEIEISENSIFSLDLDRM